MNHHVTTIERERVDIEREQRSRVLEAAALEIEVRGWIRGKPFGDSGEVCMMGAVALALDGEPCDWHAVMGAWADDWASVWPDRGEGQLLPLADWNDNHARDAADVCFVLRWRACEIRDGL